MTLKFGPSDSPCQMFYIRLTRGITRSIPQNILIKARSFSLPKYHLVKIFISIYTASDNRRIVFSTVKRTTRNVYRFSPDRALGGFDPSSSDITTEKDQSYLQDLACDRLNIKCNEVCHSCLHRLSCQD